MFVHVLIIHPRTECRSSERNVILLGKTLTELALKFEHYANENREKAFDLDDEMFEEEVQMIKSDIVEGAIPKHTEFNIAEKLEYVRSEL